MAAWRIWRMLRELQAAPTRYYRIAHILLESGAVYSILIVAALAASVVPHNTLVSDLAIMLLNMGVGLMPTLVLTLVTLGKTAEYTMGTALDTQIRFAAAPPDVTTVIDIRLEPGVVTQTVPLDKSDGSSMNEYYPRNTHV
ncbi:hypothetical protein NEOLEDRAFT_1128376 [Neolentinus lepideus HHB14362 ss-1]|uniref:Uncharacterized protein n=1 Tax=Neolentinus lepideus HHB14362 ss-1 TaxID=1314782 RepID=A0A165VF17_9AGAM|nr:hypothetical protein NEOLEDRAFT_1128376 [Neolentinus lepideus HHB14362 ss-1]